MELIQIKNCSLLKGGVLIHNLRGMDLPNWFNLTILRMLDKIVFLIPIMNKSNNPGYIYDYAVKSSGVKDFPMVQRDDISNPLVKLYDIFSKSLHTYEPHVYFLKRVNLQDNVVVITEDE